MMGLGTKTAPLATLGTDKADDGSRPTALYYVWEPPSREISIAIRLDLVEKIRHSVSGAAEHGREAGGLLLGTIRESPDSPPQILIEDFQPLHIAYERGPLFTLVEKDKAQLRKRMEAFRKHSPSLAVVGLCRGHRRRGLYMDVMDLALFREYMSGPRSVFLLVRPDPNATGGFFFWEGDSVRLQATYKEFPFDAQFLRPNSTQLVSATPVQLPTASGARHQLLPRFVDFRRVRGPLWAACGAAVLILMLVVWWRGVPHGQTSGLGLSVVFKPQQPLRLTWNTRAPAILGAKHGILRIEDGPIHISVDLTPQQLLLGSELYNPYSGDVSFILDVTGGGGRGHESIHTVMARTETTVAIATNAPPSATPQPRPILHSAPKSHTRVEGTADRLKPYGTSAPNVHPRLTSVPRTRSPQHRVAVSNRSAKSFRPPVARQTSKQPEIEPLDAVPLRVAIAAPPILSTAQHLGAPPAIFDASVAPASESKMHRFFEPFHSRTGKDFTPARPAVEVDPDVPATIAASLTEELDLKFHVSIDKNGRVTDVESLSAGADHRFVGFADIALRQWTFVPAMFKDHPVSSQLLVTMRFQNPSPAVAHR